MSTGADCTFYEKKPNRWFYKLQCYPYGYTEEYDHFGPFTTRSKADNHLRDNHANPGGSNTDLHPDHIHTYKKELRYGDDKPQDICTGCDQRKPVEMACGCVDWHKATCDLYEMTISFKISAGKARQFLDGDKTMAEKVMEVAKAQVANADKRRRKSGW